MDKVGFQSGTDDDVSCCIYGAGRGGRTPTGRSPADFESAASASSAIPALPIKALTDKALTEPISKPVRPVVFANPGAVRLNRAMKSLVYFSIA